jgi:hypothetical protein
MTEITCPLHTVYIQIPIILRLHYMQTALGFLCWTFLTGVIIVLCLFLIMPKHQLSLRLHLGLCMENHPVGTAKFIADIYEDCRV